MKNVKKNGGFTLVELIVVIAILAILAAVAIPAYSGYIAKAEEANDLQLLGAVSTAFNSACVENNIYDMTTMIGTTIKLDGNGYITGINSTVTLSNAVVAADPLFDSFVLYYGTNIDTPFKVFKWIEYTADGFKGYDAEEAEGKVIEAVKQAIANSNFNGKLDELTGDVGTMIDVLSGYLGQGAIEDIEGSGFGDYLTNVLGMEDTTDPDKMANAAVLYLAHTAANMSEANVTNAKANLNEVLWLYADDRLNGIDGSIDAEVITLLAADTGSGLAGYAMLYATAEALAIQQGGDVYTNLKNAEINNPQSVLTAVTQVFNTVDPEDMLDYLEGSQYNNDMDAYLSTLQAVNGKESELKNELDGGLLTENQTVLDLINKLK